MEKTEIKSRCQHGKKINDKYKCGSFEETAAWATESPKSFHKRVMGDLFELLDKQEKNSGSK